MTDGSNRTVKRRNVTFAERPETEIWHEHASANNPYLTETCRCHGYELFELIQCRSFVDVFYLLFRGELPSSKQARLLEILMIALINPGPRNPATRAAMNAGIGRTRPVHTLPIALTVLGGTENAGEIEKAMMFIIENLSSDPQETAKRLTSQSSKPSQGDWRIAPGFGSHFGGIDPIPSQIANLLIKQSDSNDALNWCMQFSQTLNTYGMGWLISGVAAATFCDLGMKPRAGGGLFQLLCAPGLLAHGLEQSDKAITGMPFLTDDNYVIET